MTTTRTHIGTVHVSDPTYQHLYPIGNGRLGLSYGRLSIAADPDYLMSNLLMGAVAVAHWIIDERPDDVPPHVRHLAEVLTELDDLAPLVAAGANDPTRMFPRPCRGPHDLDDAPPVFAEDGYCPDCRDYAAQVMAEAAEARDER